MLCPDCRGGSKVVDTGEPLDFVVRRRECKLCGNRWTTHERFHMKQKKKEPEKLEPRPAEPARRDRRKERYITEKQDIDGLAWHRIDDDWQDRQDDEETLRELRNEHGWKS